MVGESNLASLISSMTPELQSPVFVFATLPADHGVDVPQLNPLFGFREKEGLTLVVEEAIAKSNGLRFEYPCKQITLTIHSSLSAVGFLAAITKELAQAGISVNAVSAFFHDHLFVSTDRADDAMAILSRMSQS